MLGLLLEKCLVLAGNECVVADWCVVRLQIVSEMTAFATTKDNEAAEWQAALEESERDVGALRKYAAGLDSERRDLQIQLGHERQARDAYARRLDEEIKKNAALAQQIAQLSSAAEEAQQRLFFLQYNSALLQDSEKELEHARMQVLAEQERNHQLEELNQQLDVRVMQLDNRIMQLEAELDAQQTVELPHGGVELPHGGVELPQGSGVQKYRRKPPCGMVGRSFALVGKSYAAKLLCSPDKFTVIPCWSTHTELVKSGAFPFLAQVSADAYAAIFCGAPELKPQEFECLSGFGPRARRWRENCRILQGTKLVQIRSVLGTLE